MGLGFLVPAFLAGLAALVIPLLVHLRHKDKDRPYRFPSLMFLEQLPIRTSQRQRVTDWPLLLLRALAVALLALAFARPVFTTQRAVGGDTRVRAVVIALDRSMSMSHTEIWPAALDSARAIVAALGAKDRVGVIFFDDAAEIAQRLTDDKTSATAVLASAKTTARGTRFAPAIRTARQMLLDAPFAAAEIVVISDLQRAGTTGVAGLDLPAGVTLRAVAIAPSKRANSTVRAVEARRVSENGRSLLAVKARVLSRELGAPRTLSATLTLGGRQVATQRVTLIPEGETVVTFAPVAAPDGAVDGVVELEADALAADDRFVMVVPREDVLRVALVLPEDVSGEETLFLERALSIGRAPEVQIDRLRAGAVNSATLENHAVLLYWDATPSESAQALLTPYVTDGGGVVLLVGRRIASAGAMSSLLPAKISGMSDRLADRGGSLRDLRLEHALFTPFRDVPDAFAGMRVLRYARLDAPRDVDVLARFDDGLPAVMERRLGVGHIVALTLPLDARNGDLPLQPAFLPFVRQLMLHTSGRDAVPLWRTTAESWALPDNIADPVVRTPDGSLLRPKGDSLGRAIPMADAGLYQAFAGSVNGAPVAVAAVNVPPGESDLTPIDPKELLLGVRESAPSAAQTNEAPTPVDLERRQNPWRVLLIIVALALVGETIMATRGWRAIARRIRPVSPDPATPERSAR
ncbi:MAG: BatA and WFA domain-containing protein [Gemmatimonadaceae bacterium]|nr:BatA and WFA domain-containing protein [Gemmatimonadaceae bacterium]